MPAYLSTEMRRALANLADGPRFLGAGAREIPRSTADALIRRRLAERIEGSGQIRLTEGGRLVAETVLDAHRRLLHGASDNPLAIPREPRGPSAIEAQRAALLLRDVDPEHVDPADLSSDQLAALRVLAAAADAARRPGD